VQTALRAPYGQGIRPLTLATPAVRHVAFGILTNAAHNQASPRIAHLQHGESVLNTTTATRPLVPLANQLSQQSAVVHAVLQEQIAALVPDDPHDQEEFDAIRELFVKSYKELQALLTQQETIIEELLDIAEVAPQVA
jgi:hypothetical protein